jgi:hypothetical protein
MFSMGFWIIRIGLELDLGRIFLTGADYSGLDYQQTSRTLGPPDNYQLS